VLGARINNTWPVMYYSGREGINWSERIGGEEWAVGTKIYSKPNSRSIGCQRKSLFVKIKKKTGIVENPRGSIA